MGNKRVERDNYQYLRGRMHGAAERTRLREVLRRIAEHSEDPISAADAATALRERRPETAKDGGR